MGDGSHHLRRYRSWDLVPDGYKLSRRTASEPRNLLVNFALSHPSKSHLKDYLDSALSSFIRFCAELLGA